VARRRSSASRRSSSSARSGARSSTSSQRPRARTDGKVDIQCPQCGAAYRVGEDMLDEKIECADCHRVFFAKTTAGRRVQKPDYTKAYVGFGIAVVVIVGIFIALGGKKDEPKKKQTVEKPKVEQYSRGTHPRARELAAWAKSIGDNNQLVLARHSDLRALSKQLELADSESATVINGLQQHESTELLRTMDCSSAELDTEQDMTTETGSGKIYVTPKSGDERFKRNTNGIFSVTFQVENGTVKVTSFTKTREPIYAPGKDPSVKRYEVNKNIAKAESVTITDSAGTRTVQESKPGPMPHWDKATPAQREMADKCVADIIASADDNAPGGLFNRATLKIRSMEDKQAVIPRVLNAMYERYEDPNPRNMELSQLNRAVANWTGYAVNYQVRDSGDAEKDKKERQSCVRQWFAFWRRYHKDLSEFFDEGDNLEGDDGGK
jgi:DNA-directed RNA polymerase subunit RPC12/RpoP